MGKFNVLIPPYLKERVELIKLFGIRKFILSLVVTILECSLIFIVLYSLMALFVNCPLLGAIVLSTLLVLGVVVFGLVAWKKKKNRNDYKEKTICKSTTTGTGTDGGSCE